MNAMTEQAQPIALVAPAARRTRQARVAWGARVVTVGGDAPVRVQSMTNTDTVDAAGTARQVKALDDGAASAKALTAAKAGPPPDLSGGYKYLKLERMAYYVHKDTYRAAVRKAAEALG